MDRLGEARIVLIGEASEIRAHQPFLSRASGGQFDAVVHFDETCALELLERTPEWEMGEPPETFPIGI